MASEGSGDALGELMAQARDSLDSLDMPQALELYRRACALDPTNLAALGAWFEKQNK